MRAIETEAKALLAASGLTIPAGKMVFTPEDAEAVARSIGRPTVVKAQIPTGGRMKAGGVSFASTPEQAVSIAGDLLGRQILGYPVNAVLVEEKLDSVDEVFIGVTYDSRTRRASLLASRVGGIEVERAGKIRQRAFSSLNSGQHTVLDYIGREAAAELGFNGQTLLRLGAVITTLINCFIHCDALLLEVNPLILNTNGQWCVADVHLEIDDDAAYRQGALLSGLPLSRHEADRRSEFERRAAAIDSADHRGVAGRLVPFGGDLGLLIGGGGASLTIMDAILDAGLNPANYCEIGGNPSVWKIKELTKLILSQPHVTRLAVIMNVVSNTRVDLVARGVIKGVLELGRVPCEVITAFRIPGSWEEEGKAILHHYGIKYFDRDVSIDQVIEVIRWRS
jgi:succinyl-CoA synthetase beta subunit/citryl-CoA synthetase large subunit